MVYALIDSHGRGGLLKSQEMDQVILVLWMLLRAPPTLHQDTFRVFYCIKDL